MLLLDESQKGGIEGSHQGKQKQPPTPLEAPGGWHVTLGSVRKQTYSSPLVFWMEH